MRALMFGLMLLMFPLAASAAEIGDDGLHKEDWFTITFRDIAEDIQTAKDEGKRLVLVFEQRGCIYCREMHEKLLSDPEIRDYIKNNFMVVQYNMFGDEEVTDLDGTVLTEKAAFKKWGYLFTPTIVFMPEEVPDASIPAGQAAVATMPGLFRKGTFLAMFKWVNEKGYLNDEPFQTYYARQLDEGGAGGAADTQ